MILLKQVRAEIKNPSDPINAPIHHRLHPAMAPTASQQAAASTASLEMMGWLDVEIPRLDVEILRCWIG